MISKIDEPTDWCAGMVVVLKEDGRVRICVDLTQLNQSVCIERHILPSVEQTPCTDRRSKALLKARC